MFVWSRWEEKDKSLLASTRRRISSGCSTSFFGNVGATSRSFLRGLAERCKILLMSKLAIPELLASLRTIAVHGLSTGFHIGLCWIGLACGNHDRPAPATDSTEFRVALLTPGPVSDHSWNAGAYEALMAIR